VKNNAQNLVILI